jgi:hypothetical protein
MDPSLWRGGLNAASLKYRRLQKPILGLFNNPVGSTSQKNIDFWRNSCFFVFLSGVVQKLKFLNNPIILPVNLDI